MFEPEYKYSSNKRYLTQFINNFYLDVIISNGDELPSTCFRYLPSQVLLFRHYLQLIWWNSAIFLNWGENGALNILILTVYKYAYFSGSTVVIGYLLRMRNALWLLVYHSQNSKNA